jgi:adenylate cyclase class 2
MREIEAKLRIAPEDKDKVALYCKANGYKEIETVVQNDYYLTPHGINLFARDEALRIRENYTNGKSEWQITYKGRAADSKYHDRRELETGLQDGQTVLDILKGIGFDELLSVHKTRTSYISGASTISVDEVESLGLFLEIEYLTGESDRIGSDENESPEAIIDATLRKMKLEHAEVERKNYLELLLLPQ